MIKDLGAGAQTELLSLVVGPLDVNCYIYSDVESREAVVIDPGGDADKILGVLKERSLDLKFILNTHGHFDHVGGNATLKDMTGAQVCINEDDAELYSEAKERGAIYGIPTLPQPRPDIYFQDVASFALGAIEIEISFTPGHTPGGVCLYSKKEKLLFTGDTLFSGSIGRTDMEGGSFETIMESIRERILPLDDCVRVFPGHGPESTVGEERVSNPFIADMRL